MMTWLIPAVIWIGSIVLAFSGALNYALGVLTIVLVALRFLVIPWGFVTAVLELRKPEIPKRARAHARAGALLCGTAGLVLVSLFIYLVFLPKGVVPFWLRATH